MRIQEDSWEIARLGDQSLENDGVKPRQLAIYRSLRRRFDRQVHGREFANPISRQEVGSQRLIGGNESANARMIVSAGARCHSLDSASWLVAQIFRE